MELTIQKVIGEIGELYCEQYLSENMDSFCRGDRFVFVGTSLIKRDFSSDFDISDFREIATLCAKSGYCEFSDKKKPCKHNEFYEINENASRLLDFKDTGDNKYRWYCALRNTKVILDNYEGRGFVGADKFVRDYLVCHYFVENLYSTDSRVRTFSFLDEKSQKEHRRYWSGHPGRIDFFGKRNSNFYCIEVKTNGSRLTLWQQIRLAWMYHNGHTSQIYNVIFELPQKDRLLSVYTNDGLVAALELVKPELRIIDYQPLKYPEAEMMIEDRESVFEMANIKFKWF